MPNGSWGITRGGESIAASIDDIDFDANNVGVKIRLQAVRKGDKLFATSATGGTGIEGEIIARAGNHLIVEGHAWCALHSSSWRGFSTHTFDVSYKDTYYTGSVQDLVGRRIDREGYNVLYTSVYVRHYDSAEIPGDDLPKISPIWVR